MTDNNQEIGAESPNEFDEAFKQYSSGDSTDELEVLDDGVEEDELAEEVQEADEPAVETQEEIDYREKFESIQSQYQDLEHRYKSDGGRVSALQRKINEYENLVKNLQTQKGNQSHEIEMPEEWKVLQSDFPEIASAVEKRLAAIESSIKSKVDTVEQLQQTQFKTIEEAESKRFLQEQAAALSAAYPNWSEVANSAEFNEWVERQPDSVKQLRNSQYAADAAAMLEYYGIKGRQEEAKASAPSQIQEKRQQKLQAAESVKGRGLQPTSNAPDEFDAAFQYYAKRNAK